MTDVTAFINTLFEKSKVLNDLNTQYLEDLVLGELTQKEKIDLFYRNTQYHESILQTIKDIVKDLDKTSVILSPEQTTLLHNFQKLDELSKSKLLKISDLLEFAIFVPKSLTTCPICGGKLSPYGDNTTNCKRVPLRIGTELCGHTIFCRSKEKNINEPE